MTMAESDYRHALNGGLVASLNVPVRKPGAYQVRAMVGDAISNNIGYASQFVDVPDVDRGQLVLSGIALMGERFKDSRDRDRPTGRGQTAAGGPIHRLPDSALTRVPRNGAPLSRYLVTAAGRAILIQS
jgi:hypothetical protein